jgi:DNA topoisomerase-3
VLQQQTQPAKRFTDATLLAAMTNIARFVDDPELRKTLRETDGLGTEATRAAILETLFKRDYLFRDGRHICASDKGTILINALPDSVRKPDRTAVWEATLEAIQRGEAQPQQFLDSLKQEIQGFVGYPAPLASDAARATTNPDAPHCPKCRAGMIERKGKFGAFYACSRYPGCKGTRPLEDHSPEDGSSQKPVPCPFCFSPLIRRKSTKGWFWGCSSFPACRQTVNDVNGKPELLAKPAT